ncbi:MAG: phosphate acyltransferase PlsX [Clostridiales bacterium]|jgi:glycerol-3-phosphate acyltransferase PlsX|nr:phosphate acyltransferase PlsX [Clostridiales bacterium]
MIKVVVDAFGGDNAPDEIVKGAIEALNLRPDIKIILSGKKDKLSELIKDSPSLLDRIQIIDAPDVITNDESPTAAIRSKPKSSLVEGLNFLAADADAFVSAGSTGAVLTGATFIVGRIRNVTRAALAPLLPCVDGSNVLLIDCGANVDCKPEMLLQFGIMGDAYMKAVGIKNPRVALLSNGTEKKKGNELIKAAHLLLAEADVNFVGNIEARDIMSGSADVIVADGFNGNIALKASEGTALSILKLLKQALTTSGLTAKIGGLLIKNSLKGLKSKIDYTENGGAVFVGVNKVVVKAHGSSKAKTIRASIIQAATIAETGLVEKITEALSDLSQ